MKRVVKSKHGCYMFHNWIWKGAVGDVEYYECDICGSRKGVSKPDKGMGRTWFDDEWLQEAKTAKATVSSNIFIRLRDFIIISLGCGLILLGVAGYINDKFFHGSCRGVGVKVVANTCMTKQKNGTWVPLSEERK